MHDALESEWGRLFRHWEQLEPDARGFASVPEGGARLRTEGLRTLAKTFGVLGHCLREAPEFARRRQRRAAAS